MPPLARGVRRCEAHGFVGEAALHVRRALNLSTSRGLGLAASGVHHVVGVDGPIGQRRLLLGLAASFTSTGLTLPSAPTTTFTFERGSVSCQTFNV